VAKACDDGSAGACTSVGLEVMKRDKAAGVRLLTKACDGKDKLGCMGLGGLYLHGTGVRKDLTKLRDGRGGKRLRPRPRIGRKRHWD
jgi:TPR repeat protein